MMQQGLGALNPKPQYLDPASQVFKDHGDILSKTDQHYVGWNLTIDGNDVRTGEPKKSTVKVSPPESYQVCTRKFWKGNDQGTLFPSLSLCAWAVSPRNLIPEHQGSEP